MIGNTCSFKEAQEKLMSMQQEYGKEYMKDPSNNENADKYNDLQRAIEHVK